MNCDKCSNERIPDYMEYPDENMCMRENVFPKDPMYAHAYVPWQKQGSKVYNPCKGLERGTIYVDLDQPYEMRPYNMMSCDMNPCNMKPCDMKPCDMNPCNMKPCDMNPCDMNPCDMQPCDTNPCDIKPYDMGSCGMKQYDMMGRCGCRE
ncbi:MAG: spore coat associated protein CotJA [Clostridiales bacterium]|jgi:hypothetical protein|nr:spore coat associated protein CotJA [Clostridiales bacterium]